MQQRDIDAVVGMVRLPDAEYFRADPDGYSQLQRQLIVLDDYEGIAIGAPRSVDVGTQDRVPLLWATRETNLRAWKVIGPRNSTVVITDLVTGRVGVHDAYFGPKKQNLRRMPRSSAGSEADVVAPRGTSAGFELLDLRSVANLPWQPGRLAVTLLMYDWRSNTVEIELKRAGATPGGGAGPRLTGAEASALMEAHKRQSATTFPAFTFGTTGAPDLPGQGIAAKLSGERSAMTQRWFLDGTARLALPPGSVVVPPVTSGSAPAAMLPLSVLIAEIDSPLPRRIDIQAPVFSPTPLKAGDAASVSFRVDIGSALRSPLPPGAYQVYVVGQQHVAGPYALTVPK